MNSQPGSAANVGLRHVIKDGLALLADETTLGLERRQIVLKGLMDVFSGASRGSEIMQAQSLFARVGDKPAVEAFSLLFRYLNANYPADLPGRIAETRDVFQTLNAKRPVDTARLERAREILHALLQALRREIALKPPQRQRRFEMQ
jgi:hypothetical protein